MEWCKEKEYWTLEEDWAKIAFTDEMSIEVGGSYGVNLIWREKNEKWHTDCIGQKKKKMCNSNVLGYDWIWMKNAI